MAANIYRAADKVRVPSVSSILRNWGDPGGLMHWAHELGLAGKSMDEAREEAAGGGSLAHAMIEKFIKGEDPTTVDGPDDQMEIARTAFEGFESWVDQTKLRLIESEASLVSETHRYGGTLDALGIVHGRLALIDWKSSSKIYPKMVAQVGGYALLVEECREKPIEEVHLLRIDKVFGGFTHFAWPKEVVEIGKQAFLLARQMYEMERLLKKAVGQ